MTPGRDLTGEVLAAVKGSDMEAKDRLLLELLAVAQGVERRRARDRSRKAVPAPSLFEPPTHTAPPSAESAESADSTERTESAEGAESAEVPPSPPSPVSPHTPHITPSSPPPSPLPPGGAPGGAPAGTPADADAGIRTAARKGLERLEAVLVGEAPEAVRTLHAILRAARTPVAGYAIVAELEAVLSGTRGRAPDGKAPSPAIVARALLDFASKGEGWNAKLFRAIVDDFLRGAPRAPIDRAPGHERRPRSGARRSRQWHARHHPRPVRPRVLLAPHPRADPVITCPPYLADRLRAEADAVVGTLSPEAVAGLAAAARKVRPEIEGMLRARAGAPLAHDFVEHAVELATACEAWNAAHTRDEAGRPLAPNLMPPNRPVIAIRQQLREAWRAAEEHRGMAEVDPSVVRMATLNLPPAWLRYTFKHFEVHGNTHQAEKRAALLAWAKSYVRGWTHREDLGRDFPVLATLFGPSGTGKTHLAVAIAVALTMEHGILARITSAAELMDDLRDAFNRDRTEPGVKARIASYTSAGVLVVDDVSRHAVRGDPRTYLFDVISEREKHMRPTILTTNETAEGFEQYVGPAIASRLLAWRGGIASFEGLDDVRAGGAV